MGVPNQPPLEIDPYVAVANNPLRWIDPTGFAAGPANLGGGYTGRIDQFNMGGSSSFEIHVFDHAGREVGTYGPEGWINKHGKGVPSNLPPNLENTLKGMSVDELRARGIVPPKGTVDITGDKWKNYARKAKKVCKVLGPLSVLTSVGIELSISGSIDLGELMCDAVWGCPTAE